MPCRDFVYLINQKDEPLLGRMGPVVVREVVSSSRNNRPAAIMLNVRKMDLCIAAIALELQANVVTRNVRDFERIPNLVVEDWSKAKVSPTRFRLTCIDLLAEPGAAADPGHGRL
jgi:hypothetical protein